MRCGRLRLNELTNDSCGENYCFFPTSYAACQTVGKKPKTANFVDDYGSDTNDRATFNVPENECPR
jgi:hypothetical protein